VLVLRAIVINHIVPVSNICDVRASIYNRQVLFRRRKKITVGWTTKIPDLDEYECGGANIVIAVTPGVNADASIERCFWRKGCPTDVIVVIRLAPGDPRWRPSITWYPHPADSGNPDPAPIVICCPPKILVGVPVPTAIRPYPMPVRVRAPVRTRFLRIRFPDITVIIVVEPTTFRCQPVIEYIVRTCGIGISFYVRVRILLLVSYKLLSISADCSSLPIARPQITIRLEIAHGDGEEAVDGQVLKHSIFNFWGYVNYQLSNDC
jgi:hypothetical protein